MSESQIYLPRLEQAPIWQPDLSSWQCQGQAMGMTWRVLWRGGETALAQSLQQQFEAQLALVEQQMSHWNPASDLMRFNRAEPGWHALPAELMQLLARARFIAQQSSGCFNPCLGELVQLWGFGPGSRYRQAGWQAPAPAAIQAALASTDWRQLQLDVANLRAYQAGGLQLDLSGIAKGYAVDLLSEQLEQAGINDYLVEFGGELRGAGLRADQQPWWIEIELPENLAGILPRQILGLVGLAVASSGEQQQFFEHQGQRYSHTLDGRHGYPLDGSVSCVSVLHANCTDADAWASALYVLGSQRGMELARQEGLAVLMITAAGELSLSPALQDMLHD